MAEAGWPHLLRPLQGGRVDRCAGAHARRGERMTSAADRVIPFRWSRDGNGWSLFVERRRFGRVVPDKNYPGMWRSGTPGRRFSDIANHFFEFLHGELFSRLSAIRPLSAALRAEIGTGSDAR